MNLMLLLFQAADQNTFNAPRYFVPVVVSMFFAGAVLSLVAAVLGFARAPAFGASTRWFSFAAVCLLLFHLQFLLLGFGVVLQNADLAIPVLTCFNGFIILAAICAIMGFVRLTNPPR